MKRGRKGVKVQTTLHEQINIFELDEYLVMLQVYAQYICAITKKMFLQLYSSDNLTMDQNKNMGPYKKK